MQMENMACRDELDGLIICYHCVVSNYPKKYCLHKPLPFPPNYHNSLSKRVQMAAKGILPPTLKMII